MNRKKKLAAKPKNFIYFIWLAMALFPPFQAKALNSIYLPLVLKPLRPTITVSGGIFTYNGSGHEAAATAAGEGGETVDGSFTYIYTPPGDNTLPVNAGVYDVAVQFTSSDPRYSNEMGQGTVVIQPASPAITVFGGFFNYNAGQHPASATASGVGGTTVPGSFSYTYSPPGDGTIPVNAGSYGVTTHFTSGDPNYTDAQGSGTITVTPFSFLAFGDSITGCYFDTSTVVPYCGYPRRVYERLNSQFGGGAGNFAFYNRGWGGEDTTDGWARFPEQALYSPDPGRLYPPEAANAAPDIVIIMEGTNDLNNGVADLIIENNLRSMVSLAQQSGKRVIIATLPPSFDPDPIERQQRIPDFNPRIFSIASDYQIPVADVYSRLAGQRWLMTDDGLHPNEGGFDAMAEVFYQAVAGLVN